MRPDDGSDAEVVPLFGTRGSAGHTRSVERSIDDALAGFLADLEAFVGRCRDLG